MFVFVKDADLCPLHNTVSFHDGGCLGGVLLGHPVEKLIIVSILFLVEVNTELDELSRRLRRCGSLVGHGVELSGGISDTARMRVS